jgi:hypothetical protein
MSMAAVSTSIAVVFRSQCACRHTEFGRVLSVTSGQCRGSRLQKEEAGLRFHSNSSILRGLVHVIDNKHVHRPFCRVEAEPELFLKSREYGSADGAIRRLAVRR